MTELLNGGPESARCRLLIAHGAGAAMTSPFLELFTTLLAEREIATTRFEFAYMAARRSSGKRRPPPRAETLIIEYEAAIDSVLKSVLSNGQKLFIGGKSMGGRVASMIADKAFSSRKASGLVCLGYPFHPPGKPEQLRTAHLETLKCPALIVQGERDPFGTRAEVETMRLSKTIAFHWASDGDHDLGPRGGSGFTRKANLSAAASAVAEFLAQQITETRQ